MAKKKAEKRVAPAAAEVLRSAERLWRVVGGWGETMVLECGCSRPKEEGKAFACPSGIHIA